MQIREITLFPVRLPLRKPFVISLGPLTHAENLFVRIRTDSGHEGWGEASPFATIHGETLAGALAIGRDLGQRLLGLRADAAPAYTALMARALHGNHALKSAFDLALHDIAAQAAGLPLFRYLGGATNRTLYTDYTVSLGTPADMAEDARDIVARGFPVIKIKLGDGAEADIERVAAIVAAVGNDIPLRLDANQGWSFEEAGRALRGLARFNVQHCEAPIDRYEWTRLPELRRNSPIPLMADESCWDHHDARRLLAIGAVDRINIKLSKSGGLHTARKIIETTDVPLQVGGFLESRLGFTAAAHLALSSERVAYCDFDTPLMHSEDVVEGGITYGPGGAVTVPEAPGLGARLRPEYQLPSSCQIIIS
ncbi:L-alanine-DL-glutamate epimerase-like enolase superfamily enzyme [Lewinella marina]|uniref:Dipeptide epimerase n=1 Tax=Neolewinella marina TaxID=438751 RepID=A0A2G0CJI0_9BACT|nr:dipeptide epimerase [Neolewinella marina]NJB84743.1 L-alanine-DL-glutamate epimerase-like enolase superfamily enzyme [Neolewinella marina]PHL00098.1 dipeptide epimerase [Neolewinella marina]